MGLGISWKKAAIISAVVHLIALFIAVIFFVVVPAIQEMDTYEIDLTQSVLDDGGSGHAGGGGGNRADLFPKPLSADEVAARTKAVVANVDPSTATDIPDAVDVPPKGGEHKGNTFGDNSTGGSGPGNGGGSGGDNSAVGGTGPGSGGGSGGGHGTGEGTGVGDGRGHGTGTGDGTGEGDGHGTGKAAFNVEGFYAAVDSQKQIPYAAIKRKMNVDVTINVMAKLDTNGNLIDVYPTSGGDELFVEAALDAVRRATPYPNETGDIQPVEVPVHFVVQADGEDEEE